MKGRLRMPVGHIRALVRHPSTSHLAEETEEQVVRGKMGRDALQGPRAGRNLTL